MLIMIIFYGYGIVVLLLYLVVVYVIIVNGGLWVEFILLYDFVNVLGEWVLFEVVVNEVVDML